MPYDCQLFYQPGRYAENPVGFMSRHHSSTAPEEPNLSEFYINYKKKEIKQETKHDAQMQAFIKAVEADQWVVPEVQNYKKLKEELSAFNGLEC